MQKKPRPSRLSYLITMRSRIAMFNSECAVLSSLNFGIDTLTGLMILSSEATEELKDRPPGPLKKVDAELAR